MICAEAVLKERRAALRFDIIKALAVPIRFGPFCGSAVSHASF